MTKTHGKENERLENMRDKSATAKYLALKH